VDFPNKPAVVQFFDGLAWLGQIGMFLTLGLLVFPARLGPVALPGLAMALILIGVARPLSVAVSLLRARLKPSEKAFVAWVGLRGAVPIILATYPKLAGLQESELIFNLVFFVVLTSALIQGTSLPAMARWLGVEAQPAETQTAEAEESQS
jgi:potassium/hydrogen antiporter